MNKKEMILKTIYSLILGILLILAFFQVWPSQALFIAIIISTVMLSRVVYLIQDLQRLKYKNVGEDK